MLSRLFDKGIKNRLELIEKSVLIKISTLTERYFLKIIEALFVN